MLASPQERGGMIVIFYCIECDMVKYDGAVVSNKKCTICKAKRYRLVISREYA